MFEIYKKSWQILFRNTLLFLPAAAEFLVGYLLFLLIWYYLGLNDIVAGDVLKMMQAIQANILVVAVFLAVGWIIDAFIKSWRFTYIKQTILNKKINLMKDFVGGARNFKSLLLIKLLLFLLYLVAIIATTILLLIVSILMQFTNFVKLNSLELNGTVFIFFILAVMAIFFLLMLNAYPALLFNGTKGKKAVFYSFRISRQNKVEMIKTAIGLLSVFLAAMALSFLASFVFSQIFINSAIAFLLSLILATWPDTYIMAKYRTLKSPKP